ncbi:hypothetical protein, partial [Pantoea sp. GbtcB22]|uniref:hypothetical protein n=1 Tax=Pantoea sp. GbtcB22 TaxID=2824767 RepID=UPI001C2FFF57
KDAEQQQPEVTASYSVPPQVQDVELQEAQLRGAFASQQQNRYGESWQEASEPDDVDALQQAQLARQFADQQQQRY